jgi:hypothetical protein
MPVGHFTTADDFTVALTSNSTSTAFTAKPPQATKPTGSSTGIHDLAGSLNYSTSNIIICPYGTDSDNDTFTFRLWGWTHAPTLGYYYPIKLLEAAVTLGSQAAAFAASTFLADTITVTHGNFTSVSPADNTSAYLIGKLYGVQAIEFDWDLSGGQEAAAMNAVFRTYNAGA